MKDYSLREIQLGFAPGYSFRVRDIDGDGRCEYIAVEHGGRHLVVLDHDGKVLWERMVPNTDRHSTTALEVADVDGDGEVEVLLGEEPEGENNVLVLAPGGRVKERVNLPPGYKDYGGNAIDSFGFADLDGDGFRELVVAVNGGHLYALDRNLKVIWHMEGLNHTFEHFVQAGDLNCDGVDEIALSSEQGERREFFLISGKGEIIWSKPLEEIGPDRHVDYVAIDDVRGKGENYLLTSTGGCLFDAEGNLIWTVREEINHGQWVEVEKVREDIPGKQVLISELWNFRQPCILVSGEGEVLGRFREISPYAYPTHAYFIDWKGDGKRLIVIGEQPAHAEPAVRMYYITLLDPYGEVVLRVPFEDTSVPGWFYNFENSPAVADVDGDGREEFVFPTRRGSLLILGSS
ncbi:MAG TPA: VCBS repeat-containing protein [Candidatus Latescibacteria bacterium]|nr:VCBS repeat-containing protein [Candidatus Latescibacterota bacterium]